MCLFAIHLSSLCEMFVQIFCQFLNGIVCFLLFNVYCMCSIYFLLFLIFFWVLRVLYVFQIQVLNWICYLQIFPLVCDLSFHFLNGVFERGDIFNFKEVWFIRFFSFMECTFSVISKKSLPNSRSQRFTPVFPSRFIVSDSKFIPKVYFELIFAHGVEQGSFFSSYV